ncbi:hypothetical protein PGT21_001209 [Puccinia graminis f. sp. tritici]|uniref:Uncharacterized protein n=1 Tax=Puccinia graminis f. sp. tritici TaxID=56615 RepID=A0A5B0P4Y2_PUCGR|nr:hypothetical protein PGT21_000861 [Puccinia graminis f. sp. tritici]KAA1095580.1 hypothetical protein PGT21_001209 [Puccinia graminis f. sp. tritici]
MQLANRNIFQITLALLIQREAPLVQAFGCQGNVPNFPYSGCATNFENLNTKIDRKSFSCAPNGCSWGHDSAASPAGKLTR